MNTLSLPLPSSFHHRGFRRLSWNCFLIQRRPGASSAAGSATSSSGSNIINGQVNLQNNWSNLTGSIDTTGSDATVTGAAAGNLVDITTMNNTRVNNSQIVGLQRLDRLEHQCRRQQCLGQCHCRQPGGVQRRQRLDRPDLFRDPELPEVQRH